MNEYALTQYQQQSAKPIVIPRQFGVEIIDTEGKRYNLTHEQYAQVVAVAPQYQTAAIQVQQPAPIYIQSHHIDAQAQIDRRWMRFATGAAIVASLVVIAAICKAAFFPTPLIPVTNQPPVQPVVIVPPTPQPQPFTETDCKEAGFLGMNTVCTTVKGYR